MQTVLDDARTSYNEEMIVELKSEGTEDLDSNISRIVAWIEAWMSNQGTDEEDAQG